MHGNWEDTKVDCIQTFLNIPQLYQNTLISSSFILCNLGMFNLLFSFLFHFIVTLNFFISLFNFIFHVIDILNLLNSTQNLSTPR